jgi:hypothetical protein
VGVSAVVIEEQFASSKGDLRGWIRSSRATAANDDWRKPDTSSDALNRWFVEMTKEFPPIEEADVEDLKGSEYAFYQHFIEIQFAGPVAEHGVVSAWKLAQKHGLRLLVGDELLPKLAPDGERQTHITALDGRQTALKAGMKQEIGIAIVDPAFAPLSATQVWVREQLHAQSTDDVSLADLSPPLRRWHDAFADSIPARKQYLRSLVLLSFPPSELDKIAPLAIEAAQKLQLGLVFFEDL